MLQGPPSDEEPESELTITELKELRAKREAVLNDMETGDDASRQKPAPTADNAAEVNGIDWGMGEDAYDENPMAENPFAVEIEGGMNENLYLDDPKKTLRGWFEREGYELEYKVIFTSLLYYNDMYCSKILISSILKKTKHLQVEEKSYANFVCRIDLPIETSNGVPIIAEANVKGGKKKEAVVQCALEACRILDRHGLLRQSNHGKCKTK